MLTHLQQMLAEFECVPKRLESIICQYVLFLMLSHKKHEWRTASRIFGTHESNFCRMLSNPDARIYARNFLNRAVKRRLGKLGKSKEVYLLIDSTLVHRSGKKILNSHKFRRGGPFIEGHQFTNFVLMINDELIPLCSVPFYSRTYCKHQGMAYQTEMEMVSQWIEALPDADLLPPEILAKIHFILDTGYDAQVIQNAIQSIKAKFTVGLRVERSVNDLGAREYFRRHREIPWKTIRVKDIDGTKGKKERRFRVRAASRLYLKRFGLVNVVCSEKSSGSARKTSRKYLATNDVTQSARKTVLIYMKRWRIETWHKDMKQSYGFGDCRSQKFIAVESHINFALCAYCLNGLKDPKLPRTGTTLDQYRSSTEWAKAAKVINLFHGRRKLKALAHQELARVVNG